MEILTEICKILGMFILGICAISGIILTAASILHAITGNRVEF